MTSTEVVIASMLRSGGTTGVNTHIRQFRRFLDGVGVPHRLVTPFDWHPVLAAAVFGVRPLLLQRTSGEASVRWYRHWHEAFLRRALGDLLDACPAAVVYAQGPLEARAAMRARRSPEQPVVMAVHFGVSQADEWVTNGVIRRDGRVFAWIRRVEAEVIPRVDGLVFVSEWAREALLSWLPEARGVRQAVLDNFIEPHPVRARAEPEADLVSIGGLDPVKNHAFLLDVLAEANRAGHRLTLDIFGTGPGRATLVSRARDLGLVDQVRFRGFASDVRDRLPAYRAYVHASSVESSSLAIIEAMAAGLPVLTGAVGSLPRLCGDGPQARFWPLDDPGRAATIMLDLLTDESARHEAAVAAARRFDERFATSVVAPRLLAFLASPTTAPALR